MMQFSPKENNKQLSPMVFPSTINYIFINKIGKSSLFLLLRVRAQWYQCGGSIKYLISI
jgi:hypothetical protein